MTAEEIESCIDEFIAEAGTFPEGGEAAVTDTAAALARYHYEPVLLESIPGFTVMGKEGLTLELENLKTRVRKSANAFLRDRIHKQASLLLYHYRLLARLRRDEPEAWDEVSALYEDD